jgi:cytochrome c
MSMGLLNRVITLSFVAVLAAMPALADDRGTPEQAKALLEKAAVHFKDVGADKALSDFNDPQAGYQDRDLFIIV